MVGRLVERLVRIIKELLRRSLGKSISVKSTKPEKVLNTNDAIVKKYTSSGRLVKEPKRLDLLNYNCYRGAMSTEFVFMDDIVCLHQANTVNKYLQSEFITPIEWPPFSPGLNPAHAWATSFSPSTTSYMCTGTSESIAC
ncbi:hypothetical protein TNCV_407761 [Trichonephila clavipes]|nr:hypothetical protein TNCV_407761 [Trichonephila clavipes]